jgi:hypothetical protein
MSGVQGSVANAKDDTVFYGVAATPTVAELATDLSQLGENATVVSGHLEATGSKWQAEDYRAIEFVVDVGTSSSGFLFGHGTTVTELHNLEIDSSTLTPTIGNTAQPTLTIPGLTATPEECVINWSTEPNPLTTGASDAQRSELSVYNAATGEFATSQWTHAAISTESATMYVLTDRAAGVDYSDDCHAFRFSSGRFHTFAETREDFVTLTTEPTPDYETRREPLIVDLASDLAEVGQLVGPVHAMAAADARQNDLILTGPIVNVAFNVPVYSLNNGSTRTQWKTLPPGETDDDWHLLGGAMFMRSVPRTVNKLRVRAHVESWSEESGTTSVRLYTMTRPPNAGDSIVAKVPTLESFHTPTLAIQDHSDGGDGGHWRDLGETSIARNPQGMTWLAVAFKSSVADGIGGIRIRALTIDPAFKPGGDGAGGALGGFGG